MGTVFDTSRRPLCCVQISAKPDKAEFEAVFAGIEAELARGRPFCLMADAVATTRLEFEHVKQLAGFGQRNHALLEAHVRAMSIVVPSAMVRGALKVAFQIKTPPHPHQVARSLEEAEAFLAPYVAAIG